MDYKKLIKALTCRYAVDELDNLGCGNKRCQYRDVDGACDMVSIEEDAAIAIKELLTENQALRNAANGFKQQVEIAEAKVKNTESECDRLREATKPNCLLCESMHNNGNCMEVGGFCTAVPAAYCPLIPRLIKKIREAESRAENAERKLSMAITDIYSGNANDCDTCIHGCDYRNDCNEFIGCDYKWRGLED